MTDMDTISAIYGPRFFLLQSKRASAFQCSNSRGSPSSRKGNTREVRNMRAAPENVQRNNALLSQVQGHGARATRGRINAGHVSTTVSARALHIA